MNKAHCLMLIREAEGAAPGAQAVDLHGRPDDGSLGVRGWARAGALVRYFAPVEPGHAAGHPASHAVPHILRPLHLVAARASAARPNTRPADTVHFLAAALKLSIDLRWGEEDPLPALAEHLQHLQGPVLVCWPRETLPALAHELLPRRRVPSVWPPERHDLVWVITRVGTQWGFSQVAQRLLGGDSGQVGTRVSVPAPR